jgi:uncharacterized protein YukE
MNRPLPKRIQQGIDEANAIEASIAAEQLALKTPTLQAVADEVIATPPEPETVPVVEEPKPDNWEPKYRALQGKYDTEVPRLHQQNRDMAAQLEGLQTQVRTLTDTAQTRQPVTPPVASKLVTDKDEEEFGLDMIDLQRRVANEESGELRTQNANLLKVVNDLQETVKGLSQAQHESRLTSFDEKLLKLVPNWAEIDKEQGWLNWLDDTDPLTGVRRQVMLVNAHKGQDASRMAAIFNAYTGIAPSKTIPPVPQKSELKTQVTPRKSAASVQVPVEAKIWSSAELSAALDPRRTKHMAATEIEALNNEIDNAQREGRVRN